LEQAQQESASILNVLRALTPAEVVKMKSMECINIFNYSCFDSYTIIITSFGESLKHFGKHNWS